MVFTRSSLGHQQNVTYGRILLPNGRTPCAHGSDNKTALINYAGQSNKHSSISKTALANYETSIFTAAHSFPPRQAAHQSFIEWTVETTMHWVSAFTARAVPLERSFLNFYPFFRTFASFVIYNARACVRQHRKPLFPRHHLCTDASPTIAETGNFPPS